MRRKKSKRKKRKWDEGTRNKVIDNNITTEEKGKTK
jgi:hypothetical protein